MQQYPNKISIEGEAETDVAATAFDLDLSIKGTSLLSGSEAYRKAKEYLALQSALLAEGIPEDAIQLKNIRLSKKSGKILSSSEVTYWFRIVKQPIEKLAAVVAVLAEQPNTQLYGIEWHFEGLQDLIEDLKVRAVRAAKRSATRLADGLGISLLGVYSLSLKVFEPDDSSEFDSTARFSKAMALSRSQELEQLSLKHVGHVSVTAKIDFTVTPFASSNDSSGD